MPGHEIHQAAVSQTTAAYTAIVQKMIAKKAGAGHAGPLGGKANDGGLIMAADGARRGPGGKV